MGAFRSAKNFGFHIYVIVFYIFCHGILTKKIKKEYEYRWSGNLLEKRTFQRKPSDSDLLLRGKSNGTEIPGKKFKVVLFSGNFGMFFFFRHCIMHINKVSILFYFRKFKPEICMKWKAPTCLVSNHGNGGFYTRDQKFNISLQTCNPSVQVNLG